MTKITSIVQPPGCPPMERITYYDDDGSPLPDVEYRLPPAPKPNWQLTGLIFVLVVLALAISLSAASTVEHRRLPERKRQWPWAGVILAVVALALAVSLLAAQ